MVTEVRTGYVNVQSMTGLPWWRLETETDAFWDYGFGGNPWMPVGTWNDIVYENFPGCNVFSKKTMAHSARYTDGRSFERAITQVGSAYHFFQDDPIWATATCSFSAGPAHVKDVMHERMCAGQEKGFRLHWVGGHNGDK